MRQSTRDFADIRWINDKTSHTIYNCVPSTALRPGEAGLAAGARFQINNAETLDAGSY